MQAARRCSLARGGPWRFLPGAVALRTACHFPRITDGEHSAPAQRTLGRKSSIPWRGSDCLLNKLHRQRESRQSPTLHRPIRTSTTSHQSETLQRYGVTSRASQCVWHPGRPAKHNEQPRRHPPTARSAVPSCVVQLMARGRTVAGIWTPCSCGKKKRRRKTA
jgi:hypothetical protein